ncbi:MAG: hypothetical protein PHS37_08415 [Candidatus Omnitrophica bacterium]|nr:hypothetical protein [Candidatus Omnitrophota bacterium]
MRGKRPSRSMLFTTNGILLTRENINAILSYKGDLPFIGISLNACSAGTYRKIMGVDAFDAVVSNVKHITAALSKQGRKTRVSISMIVMKENLDELPLLPDLVHGTGAASVSVRAAEFTSSYTKDWFSSDEQNIRLDEKLLRAFERYVGEVEGRCAALGIEAICKEGHSVMFSGMCNELFDFLGIRNDGETFACCSGAFIPMGNLRDCADFWALWNSEKRQHMRTCIVNGDIPPECRHELCPYWRTRKNIDGFDAKSYRCSFQLLDTDAGISDAGLSVTGEAAISLRGRVTNSGNKTWSNTGLDRAHFFRIGGHILGTPRGAVLKELRGDMKADVHPGETIDFDLSVDVSGLGHGTYYLKLDMVQERMFWFEDRWSSPLILKLRLS